MTDNAKLLVTLEGGVKRITFNRPERRNSVDRETVGLLRAAVEESAQDGTRVVVLTGAGDSFCAGADLAATSASDILTHDVTRSLRENINPTILAMRALPVPVIARVHGHAVGVGNNFALACDLIVAAEDARFGIPEVKRGLIAGDGGLVRLPRKLPPGIAMELALTGDPLSAVDAHAHGMVNRLTPSGGALKESLELAARVAANAPMAVSASRQIVADALDSPVSDGMRAVDGLMESIMESYDAREGALAFAEKRAPVWRNR